MAESAALSSAYLCWWAGAVLPDLAILAADVAAAQPFGRAALLRAPVEKIRLAVLLPALVGILTGGVGCSAGGTLPLWAVALWLSIGLALEELREPRALAALPGVVRFLESYRSAAAQWA